MNTVVIDPAETSRDALGATQHDRRKFIKVAAATSVGVAAASYVKPNLRTFGVPAALAVSGPPDMTTPACALTFEGTSNFPPGEPAGLAGYNANYGGVVNVQDAQTGVKTIEVLTNDNFLTAIPDASYTDPIQNDHFRRFNAGITGVVTYTPPTTASLNLWTVRINPYLSAQLVIRITDASGNRTTCDPDVATVQAGIPAILQGILGTTSEVKIENGTVGLTSLEISANGQTFTAADLKPGEVRTMSLSPALVPGANTVTLTGYGDPASGAIVLLLEAR